ncbi:MAG: preprotein translocase subunit SecE [Patescibacteria group bacterium]
MAITRSKKNSLADTQVSESVAVDVKSGGSEKKNTSPDVDLKIAKVSKKPRLFQSIVEELRKVRWPGPKYVLRWSGIIIMFTAVISLSLGFFDHLFTGGIKFVDCSSEIGQNQPLQRCSENLVNYLTFRDS